MKSDFVHGKKPLLAFNSGVAAKLILFLCALALALAGGIFAGGNAGVAAAANDENDFFRFEVITSEGFNFDSPYNVKDVYPSITLDFVNEVDMNSEFWYYLGTEAEVPDDVNWIPLTSENNRIDAFGSLSFNLVERVESVETYYERYIFFRGGNEGGNETAGEYFVDSTPRKIILVNSENVAPKISGVSAVNQSGAYDLDAQTGNWSNTAVTVTAVSDFKGDARAVKFWYKLGDDGEEKPFDYTETDTEGKVRGVVTIGGNEEGAIREYSGKIIFIVKDVSGTNTYTFADRYLHLDMEVPSFSVQATVQKPDGTTPAYSSGDWTPYAVTMRLVFAKAPSSGISAVSYTVNVNGTDTETGYINSEGGAYSLRWEDEGSYTITFTVTSNASLASAQSFSIKKDSTEPSVALTAQDALGSTIVSAGEEAPVGGRAGFASQRINFALSNESAMQSGNTLKYEYSLNGGETWQSMTNSSVGTTKNLTLSNTSGSDYTGNTVRFRISAATGLYAEKDFTFAVLDSNFFNDMTLNIPEADSDSGWINEPVTVTFLLPGYLSESILPDGENEYYVYGYYTAEGYSDAAVLMEPVTEAAEDRPGYIRYTVTVTESLNNQSYSFRIYDRAGNYVEKEYDENGKPVTDEEDETITFPLVTGILKVDTEIPTASVTATIGETELSETDWAAGPVTITIVPASIPVSGLKCYPLFGEGHVSETAVEMQDGSYSVIAGESGVYSYRLVSGAGNYADFSVRLNIDSSQITFKDFEEDGEDEALWKPIRTYIISVSGEAVEETAVYDEQLGGYVLENVFNDVRIDFNSNHSGHFSVMYRVGDSGTDEGYVLYPGDGENPGSFLLELPDSVDKGTLTYAFRLRSDAVNSAGAYSTTPDMVKLIVEFDKSSFGIIVGGNTSSDWKYENIKLQFTLSDASEGLTIVRYEYSSDGVVWKDTGAVPQSDGSANWEYGGETVYIDGMTVPPPGGAYAGTMFFRAVAENGNVSNIADISVNIDTTAPEPLYALPDATAVSIVDSTTEGAYKTYYVYSGDPLTLVANRSAAWEGMAAMSFLYAEYDSAVADPNLLNFRDIGELGEIASDKIYWLRAEKGNSYITALVHFVIYDPEQDLAVSLSVGGVLSEGETTGGVTWSRSAKVSLEARASTAVYFWYSVENGEDGLPIWQKLNTDAAALDAGNAVIWQVLFEGLESGEPSFDIGSDNITTITGNARYNLRFKATDLFGNEAIDDKNYIIRIDNSIPTFDIIFVTPSHPEGLDSDYYSVDEEGNPLWITEAVNVTLQATSSSPGGVRYEYQINNSGEWQLISGTSFSTNHIVGFDDNGTIIITIRAEALANGNPFESEDYKLRIDQIVPEFSLEGSAVFLDSEGNVESSSKLSPDQWTNSDRVDIGITGRAANASEVVYYFKWSDESGDFEQWGEIGTVQSSDRIRTLTVRAISGGGNGIMVEHTFTVNIDNVPPVIHSGNIRNSETGEPLEYYIDQEITYVEANLKSATYNNFPLSNGQIIATNTVDNSNGGRVEIRVEDMAGNVTTLTFIMTIFPLNVNNITTSTADRDLLNRLENDYNTAAQAGGLTESRMQYFETLIQRLKDRLIMLETQIGAYRNYLSQINSKQSFTLESDYNTMFTYINYFETEDEQIRYPDWMQQAICEGEYRTYYLKLESEFDKLQILMEEVLAIEDEVVALPATNVVAREDYQDIIRVYNEYDSLARDQKAVFTPNLLNKLTELRRICEVLLMQDEATNISIDGEHLVGELGGSSLTVTSYAAESQYFIEAQTTLYNQMAPTQSRKILSINRLSLEGAGAEFDTGEITVTLPIPEDYRQYVYFAVYELSPDGTITKIETSRIAPDAESVYFTTDHLSTYILATTANVVVAEEPEKIYGSIAGIEVDATMLTYITYSVVAMFAVFVIIILLVAWRRRKFLQGYNRDHKKALIRRGIHSIPKGNPPPPSNPANPIERVGHDHQVYYRNKK